MHNNTEKPEKEEDSLRNIGKSITKIIVCICICLTIGLIFNSCGVSKEDIQECKSACGSRGMISASEWSCQCGWSSNTSNYVIPQKKNP